MTRYHRQVEKIHKRGLLHIPFNEYYDVSHPKRFIIFLIISVLSVFFGMLAIVLPWWIAMAFVIAPILLVTAATYPSFGIILVIYLVLNVIPGKFVPAIPLTGGLKPYEALLIFLLIVIPFHKNMRDVSVKLSLGPLYLPFVYLLIVLLLGFVNGKYINANEYALAEARNHISWLLIPMIVLCFNTIQLLEILRKALIVAGVVLSLYVILQSSLNINIMGGRVESLDIYANKDVVRSTAGGGVYVIIFSMLYLLSTMRGGLYSLILRILFFCVLITGLAVTFGRGVWVATLLALLFSSFLQSGLKGLFVSFFTISTFVTIFLMVGSTISPRFTEAVLERATGITREIEQGGSFNDRRIENAAAIQMIMQKPFFGTGFGGEYKQVSRPHGAILDADSLSVEARYIHNSFLYYQLKVGIFASVLPIVFILLFFSIYFKNNWYSELKKPSKLMPAILAGTFLSIIITSYTQPEWASPQGIAVISVLIASIWLYRKMHF